MKAQYYLAIDNVPTGPFTAQEVLAAGLQRHTRVWVEGSPQWVKAVEIPELAGLLLARDGSRSLQAPNTAVASQASNGSYSQTDLDGPFHNGMIFLKLAWLLVGMTLLFVVMQSLMQEGSGAGESFSAFQFIVLTVGFLTLICIVTGVIFSLILLYRCWALIQDGEAQTTPGAAVGCLFIPIFNFYWIFVATCGLTTEMQRYAARHRLKAPRASWLLGAAISVYHCLAVIPFLGHIAALLNLFMLPPFLHSIYQAAKSLCLENQVVEEDEDVLRHSSARHRAGLAKSCGVILLPISIAMCLSGCCLTDYPYVICLQWGPRIEVDMAAKRDKFQKGLLQFPEGRQADRIRTLKRKWIGEHQVIFIILPIASAFNLLLAVMIYSGPASTKPTAQTNADDQSDELNQQKDVP